MRAEQLRGARGMVRLGQAELAERAGVSVETIKRLEGMDGVLRIRLDTLMKIQRALEAAGVQFIPENGGGAGVRLAKRSDARTERPTYHGKRPEDLDASNDD